MQIKGLLDHAVAYRVSGFLEDVGGLGTRTELNARLLDSLHDGGVEIVSPSFMNQRQLDRQSPITPPPVSSRKLPAGTQPEQLMFDKAELAGRLTRLRQEREQIAGEIADLGRRRDEDGGVAARGTVLVPPLLFRLGGPHIIEHTRSKAPNHGHRRAG